MKILIASSIDPDAVTALEQEHDVIRAFNADTEHLRTAATDREVIVFRSGVQLSERVLDGAPNLRLLLRAGSGLDNVDLAAATRRGVDVVRVPGSSAQPVAEFTFALLLCLVRKVAMADRLLRQGHWPKAQLSGPLLTGKTLGVVGAGRIGSRVGQLGAAWGMRAIGCVAGPSPAAQARLAARGIMLGSFDTVVAEADFLCLHVPLDEVTRHLIDARVLSHLKRGSYLINVSRGGVVDEAALYPELTEGDKLVGAALDVHEREGEGTQSPFADLPNVVLTPHIGAMALDSQRLIGERVIELVSAHQKGRLREELCPEEIGNQNLMIERDS
ncbi:MAG: NAD(P)-dependent oxidoreductase [Pseudonocardiaceae bacterium]